MHTLTEAEWISIFMLLRLAICSAHHLRPVRLAYQPPASSIFLSEHISHQQPANSTQLSQQTNTSHQPPANRTCCQLVVVSL
jgi:hypothetical protein